MTACPRWKDCLLDVAMGLPEPEGLQRHLVTCSACSAALVEWRARAETLNAGVGELVQIDGPSPGFHGRLIASLDARRTRLAWWSMRTAVAVAASIAMVAAVGVYERLKTRAVPSGPAPISSVAVSQWRSPTDELLHSSADEFFQSTPRLGEVYFPLTPAGRLDTETRTRRDQ